jgi:hypothetical protein
MNAKSEATAVAAGHGSVDAMTPRGFTIIPVGAFSLAESAMFGFGQRMHRRKSPDRGPTARVAARR